MPSDQLPFRRDPSHLDRTGISKLGPFPVAVTSVGLTGARNQSRSPGK
jgi:hypothetical protein